MGSAPGAGGDPPAGRASGPRAGLCAACRHHRVVRTRTGSVFFLCTRSYEDPRYPRYPGLPVLRCAGFEPEEGGEA